MNFNANPNSFVVRFGLDPDQFEPYVDVPTIEEAMGLFVTRVFRLYQKPAHRPCPQCGSAERHHIKGRYVTSREICTDRFTTDVLSIEMIRYRCKSCGRTFAVPLTGIAPYSKVPLAVRDSILKSCCGLESFSAIAKRHHVSNAYVIRLFDEKFRFVLPLRLPRVMCIDEVCMKNDLGQKYACVLYDWSRRELVDVVASRQLPYLRDHFAKTKESDRKAVRVFVSDMYEGYETIRREFFPKAVHVVDLFHVVKLLSTAVGKLRTNAMNSLQQCAEKAFMKSHWKLFLCKSSRIPDRRYQSRKFDADESYFDMVMRCCSASNALWEGYSILQELLTYNDYPTFEEAAAFVDRIVARLVGSGSPLLSTVARSYRHWRNEIANGMARSQTDGKRISNAVAECLNNMIKSLKKVSHGLYNFERFRKRALLIFTYYRNFGTQVLR